MWSSKMCCERKSKISTKAIGVIESGIFISIICVVLMLFTIPIIVFYLPDSSEVYSFNNMSSYNDSYLGDKEDCVTSLPLSWGQKNDGNIECMEYAGTVCKRFLSQWHHCAKGTGTTTAVYVNVSQSLLHQREVQINQLNNILSNHKKCQEVALPFFCQYYFPLSDCSHSKSYTASKDDCDLIRTGVCADLWQLATQFGYSSFLPNCNRLPNAWRPFLHNDTTSNDYLLINETTNNSLTCRHDFIETELICEPKCDSFEQASHKNVLIMIYSEVVASCIGLALSIIVILLSIKNYKTMLVYPSIFVVFQIIDVMVVSLLVIVTAIDRDGLYCSYTSLLKTLDNPTPFCTLSGVLFHYSFVNMLLWWFFLVIDFFHKVMFPFHAHRMNKMKRNKFIFITVVIICTLLPIPAVLICLTVKKYRYNVHRFPTTVCISDGDIWFYTLSLPLDILLTIGVCLMIIVLWSVRRNSKNFSRKSTTQLSTAEKKILLVIISFVVFGVYILGNTSVTSSKATKFQSALTQYFTCEAFGYVEGKCDRNTFDKIYNPYTTSISYLLMGLMPLCVMSFVLKWSSVKKGINAMRAYFYKYRERKSQKAINSDK